MTVALHLPPGALVEAFQPATDADTAHCHTAHAAAGPACWGPRTQLAGYDANGNVVVHAASTAQSPPVERHLCPAWVRDARTKAPLADPTARLVPPSIAEGSAARLTLRSVGSAGLCPLKLRNPTLPEATELRWALDRPCLPEGGGHCLVAVKGARSGADLGETGAFKRPAHAFFEAENRKFTLCTRDWRCVQGPATELSYGPGSGVPQLAGAGATAGSEGAVVAAKAAASKGVPQNGEAASGAKATRAGFSGGGSDTGGGEEEKSCDLHVNIEIATALPMVSCVKEVSMWG